MTGLIGAFIPRVDAVKKVTGKAEYAGDVRLPRTTYAVLVGSGVASGRIERIDGTAAERAPGVLLVMTHENRGPLAKMPSGLEEGVLRVEPRPPLEDDHILYYGQYVAMVVAESFEQARHAASLVDVTYRAAPPVVSLDDPRGKRVVPAKALGQPLQVRRGFANGSAEAEVFVDQTYTSPTEHSTAMEPHATVASWKDGELVVHTSTQWIDGDHTMLCAGLQLPPEKVRVVAPFMGGAFGSKIATGWHTLLAALATIRVGRPVKLVMARQQVFASVGHRPQSIQRFRLGASPDGKLLAMRHHTVQGTIVEDGYPDEEPYIEPTGRTSRLMYACPSYESSHELVRLNAMKPTWVRAPGDALCQWGLESAMDELAIELGLDPVELRRRNHTGIRPEDGKPFSTDHLLACYERGAERFGWARRDPRPGSMRDGRTLLGWGMATATYPGISLGATVRLRLERQDGGVLATVSTAGSEIGQGAYSMMSIVAAEELGLPLERVRTELGDSRLPPCGTTGASGLTSSTAPAIKEAARTLREQLVALAGRAPDRDISKLMAAAGRDVVESEAKTGFVFGENERAVFQSFGAVFVEVRVDRDIGRVRVSRVVGVYDVGRVLSATTTRSQLLGGVVWGIGQALLEGHEYDPKKGMPVNPDFAGYLVPVHADIPADIDVSWIDEPDYEFNSLGCRGAGEIGITGVAAAIANAVHHATGVRVRDLPIAPESLLFS